MWRCDCDASINENGTYMVYEIYRPNSTTSDYEIWKVREKCDSGKSNLVELMALLAAFDKLEDLGAGEDEVEFHCDNQTAIRLIKGETSPLDTYFSPIRLADLERGRRQLKEHDRWKVVWVKGCDNPADKKSRPLGKKIRSLKSMRYTPAPIIKTSKKRKTHVP